MESTSEDISNAENEILKQFKRNVEDILTHNDTDAYLLKFLRTKHFHIKNAEASFRETKAFREFYSLDTMCEKYTKPEVAEKYEFTTFLGYAKDGSVVRYSSLGRGDHYGFIASMSAYKLGLYGIHVMEEDCQHQRERSKINGENVPKVTYVFDLAEITIPDVLYKCVYETGLDLLHIAQEFYPEIWGKVFFINAPPFFDTLFNLFKNVMTMSLIQNMQVLSRDSTSTALLKYIDADILPVYLGGKRTDVSLMGHKVPEKFYLCNMPFLDPSDPDVIDVWVRARRTFSHSVIVRKPNTTIRVEVRTEKGSIHMSIYYKKFKSYSSDFNLPDAEEHSNEKNEKCRVIKISPGMRVQTHMSPINDINVAPKPGIYIYRFSNFSSWFSARRLIFRIAAVESDS